MAAVMRELADTKASLADLQGRSLSDHEKAAFAQRDAAKTAQRETQTALEESQARAQKAEAVSSAMLAQTRRDSVLEVLAKETGQSPAHLSLLYDGLVARGELEGSPEDIGKASKTALESLSEILKPNSTNGAPGNQPAGFIPRDPGPSNVREKFELVNKQRKEQGIPPLTVPEGI